MMVNALDLPRAASAEVSYTDVSPSDWFYDAIMRAHTRGLLYWMTGNEFRPNQAITRGEMARILAAELRFHGHRVSDDDRFAFVNGFMDSSGISEANFDNAVLVSSLGIIRGIPAYLANGTRTGTYNFGPNGHTTRAQAATVLIRLLETIAFIDRLAPPAGIPVPTADNGNGEETAEAEDEAIVTPAAQQATADPAPVTPEQAAGIDTEAIIEQIMVAIITGILQGELGFDDETASGEAIEAIIEAVIATSLDEEDLSLEEREEIVTAIQDRVEELAADLSEDADLVQLSQ
jgi:hypothetical protein